MFTAHIISLIFSGIIILIADHDAFSWFRGKIKVLDSKKIDRLHIATWIGLIALIITGGFLFYPARNYLIHNPFFIIKMVFVAILVGNGFLIGKLTHVATQKSFSSLTKGEKWPLFLSGTLSAMSWIGATIAAFFLFD
ncbi:MAG: hypothetical protein WC842_00970 [Candidatus Paceibacterota bacterium]|jgi:hypothetical protein